MRTKLLTAFTGVTLCLAFALNPDPILAEDESAELQPGVSLRQRIHTDGDGTIDADVREFKRDRRVHRSHARHPGGGGGHGHRR